MCQILPHLRRHIFRTVLGFEPTADGAVVGVLGLVAAYYGCVEAQGRGTLHCHMLVWLQDGLNPDEIKHRVTQELDIDFKQRLLAYPDDTISTSVPDDPPPLHGIPSSMLHPSTVRAPKLGNDGKQARQLLKKDQNCQAHRHTFTCFKYGRGPPEPRECRFRLDESNYQIASEFHTKTGELRLRCLDGLVNPLNETILAALECNSMDIRYIGSGLSAKGIRYYIHHRLHYKDAIEKCMLHMLHWKRPFKRWAISIRVRTICSWGRRDCYRNAHML